MNLLTCVSFLQLMPIDTLARMLPSSTCVLFMSGLYGYRCFTAHFTAVLHFMDPFCCILQHGLHWRFLVAFSDATPIEGT
ncbi:hypothetical protein FKM82_024855 [Ascaphus truei]